MFLEAKILLIDLLKQFLRSISTESNKKKKGIKHFNKNFIMSEEEEEFLLSNTCWICKKVINDDDEKVRYHCHVTG